MAQPRAVGALEWVTLSEFSLWSVQHMEVTSGVVLEEIHQEEHMEKAEGTQRGLGALGSWGPQRGKE